MDLEEFEQILKATEGYITACTYNVIFTNDITVTEVYESIDMLKHSPLYRHRTKQLAGYVLKWCKSYEKVFNRVTAGSSEFIADANETFTNDVRKDIEILYYCIKRVFDARGICHSGVIARLELARTMCELSCINLDKREQELYGIDKRLRKYSIAYLRQTGMRDSMNRLMSTLDVPSDMDVNNDECVKAINILARRLADGRIIAKAIAS